MQPIFPDVLSSDDDWELEPPELDPPELDPLELEPPELDPPELDPPELEPPELEPPELDPLELEPPELPPPELPPPLPPPELPPLEDALALLTCRIDGATKAPTAPSPRSDSSFLRSWFSLLSRDITFSMSLFRITAN